MESNKTCRCCICGYQWKAGQSGKHNCSDYLLKKIEKLTEALEFYADPDSYYAIGFSPYRCCGPFMKDFSDDHESYLYNCPMPGKLARQVLK